MKYKQRFKDIPIDKSWTNKKDRERFINEVAELAFGEGTIERGFDMQDVLDQLHDFSDNALKYEEGEE